MAQRTNPSVGRNSGRTERIRRRRLAGYNTPSKELAGVLGRTREKDNAERKATGRKRSINRSARSRYATPRRSESRAGGRMRRTPFHSGKFAVDVDDSEIAARYQQIMDIYARGKINTKNAWRLKLVENIERMISLEAHGNFKKCSATIAAATQIYHYRVDDVYTKTFKMLSSFGGVGDSTGVSAKRKKPVNVNTLISRTAAAVDLKRVVCQVDPMFHKTTSAFDEGGSRGLLMNNLIVHNGCDIIFDSTTVVTKRPKRDQEEKKDESKVEEGNKNNTDDKQGNFIPEKESSKMDEDVDSDEEHPSWVSTVSASHEVHRFQAREICPGIRAITDAINKVEEADKKHSQLQSESTERGPKRLNFADDPNEVMDFSNIDTGAMFDGDDFNPEQQEADMLQELERSQQHPDYFYTSSTNNSFEVPHLGGAKTNPSIPHGDYSVYLENDPRVSEEHKENFFFHPSLLNSWTGPERWISRRQLFRRRFKQLQQSQAEQKKKAKKRDLSEHQINFQQIVEGKSCPDEWFCPPKRPFSTMLTMASQEKLRNELNIYPEDLHIERKILTQLFMKPSLHVSRMARTSEDLDYENNVQDFWDNDLDVTCARSEHLFDADPIGSPKASYQGLQLVNDRPDVGPLVVEYARISKKINIKTLKDNIWRYIQSQYSSTPAGGQQSDSAAAAAMEESTTQVLKETLEQPDRGVRTHQGATTFKSTLRHICMDSRQKDELSVPFAFMALLHLANLKSLRFVPMKDASFGSDFHIYADKVGGGC